MLCEDARHISAIESGGVNAIIADLPWSIFEQIDDITEFYVAALCEMERILTKNGVIVLASAKKAGVFVLSRN